MDECDTIASNANFWINSTGWCGELQVVLWTFWTSENSHFEHFERETLSYLVDSCFLPQL